MSILMAMVVAVGRWCGWQPGAKASMMIVRPPQHGHGCAVVGGSVVTPSGHRRYGRKLFMPRPNMPTLSLSRAEILVLSNV